MRYDDFRRSDDIEDRRDDSGGGGGGGGGFGLPIGGGGLGIGTIIVLGLSRYAFGIDPRILIGGAEILTGGGSQAPSYQTDRRSGPVKTGAPTDEMGSMISGILGEIDDRWSEIFQAAGNPIPGRDRAVSQRHQWRALRHGAVGDGAVLLPAGEDRSFSTPDFSARSKRRFHGCSGNACKFTAAYIIAHEAGHHIQNLLGILPRVTRLQQQAGSKAESNALQVKVELQADCLSGVWANLEAKKRPGFLEAGDIDAAPASGIRPEAVKSCCWAPVRNRANGSGFWLSLPGSRQLWWPAQSPPPLEVPQSGFNSSWQPAAAARRPSKRKSRKLPQARP